MILVAYENYMEFIIAVFINKVLLEHTRNSHLFMY